MEWVEPVAFVLGVTNVALVVRRSVWNYPFALAMVSLYAVVFADAKLYSDALLQVFFFAINIYGWVIWSRAAATEGEVRVRALGHGARMVWAAGCLVAIALWGGAMSRFTDASLPWWDATVAILSVAAQIMLSRRWIDNWVLWIVVDILSIGLYAAKGLWPTMVLYVIFLGLAIWGLLHWRAVREAGPDAA